MKKAIMFVDDSATMRTIAEKTFAAEPFDVVAVPSGEAAVAKFREIRPALALVDVGMAGVNGYDVCKAIRDDAELGRIPVIAMSGVSTPYDENRGRDVGATEHIKKPFDTAKLIERVVELTSSAASSAVDGEAIPLQPRPAPQARPVPVPPAPMPGFQAAQVAPRAPAPPVAPVAPRMPVRPGAPMAAAPARGLSETPVKETMEFGKPVAAARPVAPAEKEPQGAPQFQVGTLAELAQLDAVGKKAESEARPETIELAPARADSLTATPAVKIASGQISAAATEIAAKLGGGLTAEQVDAIQKLAAGVIERVVWEVVPDLAEAMIREKLEALLEK